LIRRPSGYAHLGVYSAAARWQQLVLFIPMQVRRAVFPALTDRFTTGDEKSSIRMLKYYTILFTSIALGCAVVLSVLSRLVMACYGQEFVSGWPVLVVVAFSMVLLPFRWSLEMYYRAAGAVWSEFMLNIVWVAVLVAGMVFLPFSGAMRLAVAAGVAFLVANIAGLGRAMMIHRLRSANKSESHAD